MEELDIWRSAKVLVEYHGDKARGEALDRIANAREDGKPDAEAAWWRILRAVEALQRERPKDGENIN
jgi:hypothetical protein